MTSSYLVDIDGIGPVRLERSRRARHIIIYVKRQKEIRVAVPPRTAYARALEFVLTRKKWITEHITRLKRAEARENRKTLLPDSSLPVDRASARQFLVSRVRAIAEKEGFSCGKISIRNQRSRWGSCSAQNNLSLNIKLLLLPEPLMDYVILHELVHTRVRNHGPVFWAELDKYAANSRLLAKKLRKDFRLAQ